MSLDPTRRFSSRVNDYIRYRPRYPSGLIPVLSHDCQLSPQSFVVDVGSGTGFFSELFLAQGNPVIGVEPNADMRRAGEHYLESWENFQSVEGRAEAIPLEAACADFIVAGQAFHWFNPVLTRQEFARVLKPGGWVVFAWNDRETQANEFSIAYERLLNRHEVDYSYVNHRHVDTASLKRFFGSASLESRTFANEQYFDFDGLKGRLLSSSYTPQQGHPNHEPMIAELDHLFRTFAVNGMVRFEYTTRLYYAQLFS